MERRGLRLNPNHLASLDLLSLLGLLELFGLLELLGLLELFGLLELSVLLWLLLAALNVGDVDPKDVWRVGCRSTCRNGVEGTRRVHARSARPLGQI